MDAMDICPAPQKNPLKRSLNQDDLNGSHNQDAAMGREPGSIPTPPLTASPNQDVAPRQPSPAPSNSTLSSVATFTDPSKPSADNSSAPPAKKRKLTNAEKESQRLEKEHKKREREEEKAKRDEEKRMKDEERRRKREEREAKEREKELEKQRKEHERQLKEEEKLKKERSQPKLAAFFAKPKTPVIGSTSPVKSQKTVTDVRQSSLREPEEPSRDTSEHTPSKKQSNKRRDYERKFLPFQLPSHTIMAPYLPPAVSESDYSQESFDRLLETILSDNGPSRQPDSLSTFFADFMSRSRGLWQPNAREVMESLNGDSHCPIDLTDESGETYRPEDLLKSVTIRHLHFAEDVRPPYSGSYTKPLSPRSTAKLKRRPYSRVRKDTNYDYDSEAEWEEAGEGEDLLSDGEDDEESIGAPDEMEDFLDEDEAGPKRRLITGDLEPVSTGLCWEGTPDERNRDSGAVVDLDSMRLEFFLELPKPSINPFSSVYWPQEATRASHAATTSDTKRATLLEGGKIVSPRPPLQPRSSTNGAGIIGAVSGTTGPIMVDRSAKLTKPTAKPLKGNELKVFREAVVGSNVPKTDLLKALKKRFPSFTNDTIKSTLTERFKFSGGSRVEKVWTFAEQD
ncbi:hypothetical protein AAFC00_000601 [Neodothiora populina]